MFNNVMPFMKEKIMVYDMLGYCWDKNMFYSAKWRSLDITLLASFTPGWEHLNPVFINVMPFLKENMVYDMLGYCWGKNMFYSAKWQSLDILLASFTPGQEHLIPVFNSAMLFLNENITG